MRRLTFQTQNQNCGSSKVTFRMQETIRQFRVQRNLPQPTQICSRSTSAVSLEAIQDRLFPTRAPLMPPLMGQICQDTPNRHLTPLLSIHRGVLSLSLPLLFHPFLRQDALKRSFLRRVVDLRHLHLHGLASARHHIHY